MKMEQNYNQKNQSGNQPQRDNEGSHRNDRDTSRQQPGKQHDSGSRQATPDRTKK